MSFISETLYQSQNFLKRNRNHEAGHQPEQGKPHQRKPWRWLIITVVIILLGGALWAMRDLINPSDGVNEGATTGGALTVQQPAMVIPQESTMVSADGPVQIADQPGEQTVGSNDLPAANTSVERTDSSSPSVVGIVAIVGINGAAVAEHPGGAVIETWPTSANVTAIGRTENGSWLMVQAIDQTSAQPVGWVARAELFVFGVDALPVMAPTVAPADVPAAMNTATTTQTILATPDVAGQETITSEDNVGSVEGIVTGMITGAAAPRLNVRAGAQTTYAIIAKAYPDERYTILARDESGIWLQIVLPDVTEGFGWVAADYLQVDGDVGQLPISTAVSEAPVYVEGNQAATSQPSAEQPATTTAPETTNSADTATTAASSGLQGTIVFQSSPGGMIYAYDLESGQRWELTYGFDPAISPSGQQVTFVREGGENGLYLINIDGSNEHLIFSGRETLSAPKWSPDGDYILFTRRDEYSECVDLGRGGCVSPDSLPPGFADGELELSRDYEFNLARVDVNGDNYRDLSTLESARAADWNAAGIIYQSSAGLQVTADLPDATTQLVIHDPLKPAYEDPDWQPNGGQIAFVSRSGDHREIYVVNPDGSGMIALTRPVTALVDQLPSNVAPAWSPDGEYIIFLSNRGANHSAGAWQLWVMDADGSNQRPLGIDLSIDYTYGNEQVVSWGI